MQASSHSTLATSQNTQRPTATAGVCLHSCAAKIHTAPVWWMHRTCTGCIPLDHLQGSSVSILGRSSGCIASMRPLTPKQTAPPLRFAPAVFCFGLLGRHHSAILQCAVASICQLNLDKPTKHHWLYNHAVDTVRCWQGGCPGREKPLHSGACQQGTILRLGYGCSNRAV